MELQIIQNKIYDIRGVRVMLDFDLAALYGIETAQLKRAVRRNIERFSGDDFMFVPTHEELSRCQIGTLNKGRGSNIKYLPFAFSELGVAMLSSVLNSGTAIEINRGIMRAFVMMRHYLVSTANISAELAEIRTKLELLERNDEVLAQNDELIARDGQETLRNLNDLSEDIRKDIDNLYNAIGELSVKPVTPEKPHRPIGYRRPGED